MNRASGVLMHISSLFGNYSIGSFGKEAKYFIDFLKDCGFKYWQVLPFCMTDEYNSPYKSYSSFAGNLYFVDLQLLYEEGLLTTDEMYSAKQKTPYSCEFDKLRRERYILLHNASNRTKNKKIIEEYAKEHEFIEEFAYFMALKEANSGKEWDQWDNDEIDEQTLFTWKFIQYKFFEQWSEIKKYANTNGVKIIGDLPFYVSYDSCDVWSQSQLYQLDKSKRPECVAGVPPDYFSEDGQMWGNPLYNWSEMKKDGYKWWKDRMKHMFKMFDVVRIDHFRGIESYYSIPSDAVNAKEGKWEKGPGRELVDAINSIKGENAVIAEDLGDITEDVQALVEYSGFPGMRVFQFGFLYDSDNIHLPHNYTNNSFAYTGTHDNNTLLGYVWESNDEVRARMLKYCGYFESDWNKCYDSIIRTVFSSNAGCVILPIQDLLCYGADTRINTPGKAEGNWMYRITREQLDSIDKDKYRELNNIYKR